MEKSKLKQRIENFTWNSRHDLYQYFEKEYHIKQSEVNKEIYKVMKSFRLRKGRPIDARELWQKAGSNLERRLR